CRDLFAASRRAQTVAMFTCFDEIMTEDTKPLDDVCSSLINNVNSLKYPLQDAGKLDNASDMIDG
ncbi:hypothetical protein, partial [Legionella erythra]|uniref:hypothetical protein n=1 Tax=Legionella erythra TaxID=448 RepID=UPI001A942F2C